MDRYRPQIDKVAEAAKGNLDAKLASDYKYLEFVLETTYLPADGKVVDKDGLIKKFKTQKYYK